MKRFRKAIRLPVLGFLFLLNSCSSANKMLISGEAFSVEVQKGNVQVNETGEELNPTATKVVTVYLHTKTDKLLIDSAWLNNIPYTFNIQPIAQAFEIGYNSRNEKVTVKPTDKGFLYQVTIVPLLKAGEEALAEVRLRYRYRNKVFYKTVAPIVAIRPFDAQ